MNKHLKTVSRYLLPTAVLGLVGAVFRSLALTTGIDDKGLLIRFNLPFLLTWVLTAGVCLWLLLSLRKLTDGSRYRELFPRDLISGILSIAGGVLMAMVVVLKMRPDPVWIWVTGLIAAAGMIFAGTCRIRGLHPNFLFHGFICVFFIYQLVLNYQDWNANPQIHNYAVQMLACVALMLGSFHRACCDANIFNRRKLGFSMLMAVYLCLVSMSDGQMGLYYLAAGLWAAGNVCRLDPLPVRAKVTEESVDEEPLPGEKPEEAVPEEVPETPAPEEILPPEPVKEKSSTDDLEIEGIDPELLESLLNWEINPE